MKKIIEYLPLITGSFIYFGLCNLYFYYKEFHIEIYSFISTTDILLCFFPNIVSLTYIVYFGLLLIVQDYIKYPNGSIPIFYNLNEKGELSEGSVIIWIKKYSFFIFVLFQLPFSVFGFLLIYFFDYKSYELADYNLFVAVMYLSVAIILLKLQDNLKILNRYPIAIYLTLIIFMGQKLGDYRKLEATQTKEVKPSSITNLKFVYKDCVVETSKSNYLIGQTASYFFIYNKILKKTSVYEISKLEDIVVN